MVQFLTAILSIYIGLAISLEQLYAKILKFLGKTPSELEEAQLGKVIHWFGKTDYIAGLISFIVGFIILIAPTPTIQVVDIPAPHIQEVTQRFVGDLLPSIMLILGGLVLNTKILGFFNFGNSPRVTKFENFMQKNSFWIGLLTMFLGFLHLIMGRSIFF